MHVQQSVHYKHYNDMHVQQSVQQYVIPPYYFLFGGVEWVENGGTWVVNEPYITKNNDL